MVHRAEFLAFAQQLYIERLRAAWAGGTPLQPIEGCSSLKDFMRAGREAIAAASGWLSAEEHFVLSMQAQREALGDD